MGIWIGTIDMGAVLQLRNGATRCLSAKESQLDQLSGKRSQAQADATSFPHHF